MYDGSLHSFLRWWRLLTSNIYCKVRYRETSHLVILKLICLQPQKRFACFACIACIGCFAPDTSETDETDETSETGETSETTESDESVTLQNAVSW